MVIGPAGLHEAVARGIERGGNVLIVTGAGISVASGIRTYRGDGGLWTEEGSTAMARATAAFFFRKPEQSWAWHLARRTEVHGASPNTAHHAVADLEKRLGKRMTLVTQNIDRLHLRAGSTPERTIEVHGHVDGMRCSAGCDGVVPIPSEFDGWIDGDVIGDEHRELLVCPKCGFVTRPHVLWFDEFYDEEHFRMRSAGRAAAHASLCITVGTSGGVPLATRLAGIAAKARAVLIDINPHDNALRHLACASGGTFADGTAGDVLPVVGEIVDRLEHSARDRFALTAYGGSPAF